MELRGPQSQMPPWHGRDAITAAVGAAQAAADVEVTDMCFLLRNRLNLTRLL